MILLASQSPRRRELLKILRLPFRTVDIKDVEEVYDPSLPAEEVPCFLSRLKASAYTDSLNDDDILVTADTVVILRGEILGKPADLKEAVDMLRKLSGQTHKVVTGVTITTKDTSATFSSVTEVKFAELSDADIDYYINIFHPLDKAGAYGIQEWIGAVGIERIEGSYYNVMGLPVHRLYKELIPFIHRAGISPHNDI